LQFCVSKMAGISINTRRSNAAIVRDWAKFTHKDMSDDILDKAFGDGNLLESLDYSVNVQGERVEVVFEHLMYGAFQDMGVSRGGYTFKPNKWYARNISYSFHKLGEIMLRRTGHLGMVRMREAFPEKIHLG